MISVRHGHCNCIVHFMVILHGLCCVLVRKVNVHVQVWEAGGVEGVIVGVCVVFVGVVVGKG